MGLLDDAIREHLDLKRRRGADPGEVAREQREALDPVPRREPAAPDGEIAAGDQGTGAEHAASAAGLDEADAEQVQIDPTASQDAGRAEPADIGETVEIDMQSVLGGDEHDTSVEPGVEGNGGGDGGSTVTGGAGPLPEQDSLEWEVPAEGPGEQAAQESSGGAPGDEASAEDVLEETPDFLRDTPEQERLWFEQRPPRDFDFDK
jgi:hypothetical protein